jgi:hypothetical protein
VFADEDVVGTTGQLLSFRIQVHKLSIANLNITHLQIFNKKFTTLSSPRNAISAHCDRIINMWDAYICIYIMFL